MVAGGSPLRQEQATDPKKTGGDNRRSNKPIMEKRRRARINNCLNELKALILDAMKKDPARHSKLEKADILEMTVKHLESLRADAGSPDRFRAGYRACVGEVARFAGLEPGLRRRLVRHLETGAAPGRPHAAPTPPSDAEDAPAPHNTIFISAGAGAGLRLVPTRLPNGDIALVLPAAAGAALPSLAPLSPRASSASSGASEPRCLSPASSAASEPRCLSPASSGWGSPPPADPHPLPLALVTRRDDDRPWRPW